MDTGSAPHLGDTDDRRLHFFAGLHHNIGHLIDDDNNIGHFTAVVFLFVAIGVRDDDFAAISGFFLVVRNDIFNAFFGEEGIAASHFVDRPLKGGDGLGSLGDNRSQKMGNIGILNHLNALWVDNDKLKVGGGVAIEEGNNHGIGHNGLTRAGRTGDEEVGHLGEVGDDGFTGDVFTDREGQRVVGIFPFGTFEEGAKTDGGRLGVRDFDADERSTGDRSFDADFSDGKVERKLFVASENLGEVDPGGRLEGILGHARANIGAVHLDVDTEIGEGRLNNKGVLLDVARVGRGRDFFEKGKRGHFPIRVANRNERALGGFFGL